MVADHSRLGLQITPTPLKNDTKQSDSEAQVMLEFWGTHSSFPLLPGPPNWTLSMGQIELFIHCVLMLN